ncbi:MAG: toxin-antitoxin system YwqK family antitoxin [Candidatus Omnitrophica bacterium]|nr:toxin-antitoxin system YwqK family antitoxin [Candidatus Omnitrophota bacterium]
MKIYIWLLALLMIPASSGFAQNVNPARMYEEQRGTQTPVEGVWHVYDRQGKLLREENYHNYRLDGEMKIFYPSGALKEFLYYSDGLREGNDKAYYENGGLEFEVNYKDNDLDGDSVHYYDTGEVKNKEHFVKGKLEGRKQILYKNGNLKQSSYYVNGLLDGALTSYAENGQVTLEEHYLKGHLISHNEYGEKSAYVAKNNSATNASAPAPNNAPAPADRPSKLGGSTYDNPS